MRGISFIYNVKSTESLTRGIVGNCSFAVLPDVPPIATFLLTFLSQLVYYILIFSPPCIRFGKVQILKTL